MSLYKLNYIFMLYSAEEDQSKKIEEEQQNKKMEEDQSKKMEEE